MPAHMQGRRDSSGVVLLIIPGLFLLGLFVGLQQLRSRSPELRQLAEVDAPRIRTISGTSSLAPSGSRYSPQTIRVVLHEGLLSTATIECATPYVIQEATTSRPIAQGANLRSAEVEAIPTGLRVGPHLLDFTAIRIVPQGSGLIGFGGNFYRGSFTIHRTRSVDGLKLRPSFSLVNHVPLENYVASVVDSEMPATFPQEARDAQAIVARTYAIARHKIVAPSALFDVYGSTRSQKYLGAEYIDAKGRRLKGETPAGVAAAQRTEQLVLTCQGQIFTSYYSAVCGGRTLDGSTMSQRTAPCLKSVTCDGCRNAPLYRWQVQLPAEQMLARLSEVSPASTSNLASLMTIRMRQEDAGRLPQFTLTDGRHFQQISSTDLRRVLGTKELPSPQFSLRLANHQIEIEGQGSGHCVGFCQYGAKGLAETGMNARGIVQHYYPGAEVSRYQSQPLHAAEAPNVASR
jgi:stage II sporulation protein D